MRGQRLPSAASASDRTGAGNESQTTCNRCAAVANGLCGAVGRIVIAGMLSLSSQRPVTSCGGEGQAAGRSNLPVFSAVYLKSKCAYLGSRRFEQRFHREARTRYMFAASPRRTRDGNNQSRAQNRGRGNTGEASTRELLHGWVGRAQPPALLLKPPRHGRASKPVAWGACARCDDGQLPHVLKDLPLVRAPVPADNHAHLCPPPPVMACACRRVVAALLPRRRAAATSDRPHMSGLGRFSCLRMFGSFL